MSFCLTDGLLQACNDACAGGVEQFYVAPFDAVQSVTVDASGAVTAITMQAGPPAGVFYLFEGYQETTGFTETGTRENANTSYEQVLVSSFICRSQEKRNVIAELQACACGLVVIHTEASGKRWIWGLRPSLSSDIPVGYACQLTANEGVSGQAITDVNQETITLTAKSTAKARELDAAVVIPV
jgi:hypothetical protein